ncbi:hypothetical protein HYX70_03360 [Candidatus Saccharibacteria bacterium]|nr:hypothetical protein [Candidatus Saccharibacteria bacterium]
MYCYIAQEPKGDAQHELLAQIIAKLSSGGIEGKQLSVSSTKQITNPKFRGNITAECKTLIAIGDDTTFESLLSISGFLPPETAYGYIPIEPANSRLAVALKIKTWQEAVTSTRSRRIEPRQLLKFNGGVVLFEKIFTIKSSNRADVSCQLDKLELNGPVQRLRLRNLSGDEFQQSTPIGITAFGPSGHSKEPSDALLFGHKFKNNSEEPTQNLLFRIHAAKLELSSPGAKITDQDGMEFTSPLHVEPAKKPIRLIVKKLSLRERNQF